MKHTVLITGAAGYVGGMLVERFAQREDVGKIIGLDKEAMSMSENTPGREKVSFVVRNTADTSWPDEIAQYGPDIVIHCAWQIREMYGEQKKEWHWNVEGSEHIFKFAFSQPSVKRLVHYSTVASYGAYPDNTIDHFYKEDELFRVSDYLYAEEKRVVEEKLKEQFDASQKSNPHRVQVAIVRPAAITGPRGRFQRIRFGLQSALSGQLTGSPVYSVIKAMVAFVPATPKWLRQFVHEDDIADITELLAFRDTLDRDYEAFNIAPPGACVFPPDMAKAVGKKILMVDPQMVRIAFFVMWHLTSGRVPTSRGSWKGYSFPIAVDGSKIAKEYGYQYRMSSFDAFYYTDGRYEGFVPEAARRPRPPQESATSETSVSASTTAAA